MRKLTSLRLVAARTTWLALSISLLAKRISMRLFIGADKRLSSIDVALNKP